MIANKLTKDIARIMHTNTGRYEIVLQQAKAQGFLGGHQINQLHCAGFPIVAIYAKIRGVPVKDIGSELSDGIITYEDFLCILGIFAQDIAASAGEMMARNFNQQL